MILCNNRLKTNPRVAASADGGDERKAANAQLDESQIGE